MEDCGWLFFLDFIKACFGVQPLGCVFELQDKDKTPSAEKIEGEGRAFSPLPILHSIHYFLHTLFPEVITLKGCANFLGKAR